MAETNNSTDTSIQDEKITALLSTLRQDPTPEADFESRFLADFHRRLAEEKQPVSLLSRARQFFSTVWQNKTVWGTSFAAALVLCTAYIMWIPDAEEAALASNQVQTNNVAAQIGNKGMRHLSGASSRFFPADSAAREIPVYTPATAVPSMPVNGQEQIIRLSDRMEVGKVVEEVVEVVDVPEPQEPADIPAEEQVEEPSL